MKDHHLADTNTDRVRLPDVPLRENARLNQMS